MLLCRVCRQTTTSLSILHYIETVIAVVSVSVTVINIISISTIITIIDITISSYLPFAKKFASSILFFASITPAIAAAILLMKDINRMTGLIRTMVNMCLKQCIDISLLIMIINYCYMFIIFILSSMGVLCFAARHNFTM